MNRTLILCFLLSLSVQAQTMLPERVSDLGWLSGHWSDGKSEEVWSKPGGDTLLGFHRKIEDGTTKFYEFLRIDGSTGVIQYWADPAGQELTRFPLHSLEGQTATFLNPTHDFPKQIVYRRVGDELFIEVSNPGEKTLEWRLKKVED